MQSVETRVQDSSGASTFRALSKRDSLVQDICVEAKTTWGINKIAISHRTGEVCVGQPSVIIAVSSAHRKAALEVSFIFLISSISCQQPD